MRSSCSWVRPTEVMHCEVAALPEADREAFVLFVLRGPTLEEVSERLGRTPGAIADHLRTPRKCRVAGSQVDVHNRKKLVVSFNKRPPRQQSFLYCGWGGANARRRSPPLVEVPLEQRLVMRQLHLCSE